jgi:hypothetical protein
MPIQLILRHLITRLIFGEEYTIVNLLIMQSPPLTCYLVPLRSIYLFQHANLEHSPPTFLPQYGDWVSHPCKATNKIIVPCISTLYFGEANGKTKPTSPKGGRHSLSSSALNSPMNTKKLYSNRKFCGLVEGDQNVSVHLMNTMQTSGAQILFDHPVLR